MDMEGEGCESDTMLDPLCNLGYGLAHGLQHIPGTQALSQYKNTIFPCNGNPIILIRWWRDRLIFMMGIPMQVK